MFEQRFAGAWIDDGETAGRNAQDFGAAVAVEIRHVQLLANAILGGSGWQRVPGPRGTVVVPAQQVARWAQTVQLAVAVGIGVGNRRCHQIRCSKVVETRHGPIQPCAVVLPDVVRWRAVEHQNVEVAVAVEVADQHLPTGGTFDAVFVGQTSKRSVAVVVEQLVAGAAGHEDVEVPVVIGVEHRTGGTGFVVQHDRGCPRCRCRLAPIARAAGAAQDDVQQPVVVDVSPHRCARFNRCQWVVDRLRKAVGVATEYREGGTGSDQILPAVAIEVCGRNHTRRCRRNRLPFAKQRTSRFDGDRRLARRHGQRRCFGAHSCIREAGQTGGGIGLEALVVGQQPRRLVDLADAPQRLRPGPVGAAQIRVQSSALQQPIGGCRVVALLEKGLAEEIGGVGVVRVGVGNLPKQLGGGCRIAKIEVENGGGVERPQMVRIVRDYRRQNVQRQMLVAFLLPIERGDGQVHASVQPSRRLRRDIGEHGLGGGVFVASHQRHAAVVCGDRVGVDGIGIALARRNGQGKRPDRDGTRQDSVSQNGVDF